MERWDTETTARREHVPEWLVETAQLWAAQSATRYQSEYQHIKRFARAANIPPFVAVLRMFRDTYQVSETTTEEQFQKRVHEQIQADGGQMFMHLSVVPTEEVQRATYIKELEAKVTRAAQAMQEAIDSNNEAAFQEAAATSGQSQELWLIVAQQMTPEQARATMIDFAHKEVTQWMRQRQPGPPPPIFSRYTHHP